MSLVPLLFWTRFSGADWCREASRCPGADRAPCLLLFISSERLTRRAGSQ